MQVYIGIDWSENKHDIEFMNEAGACIVRLNMPATLDGLVQMDATRQIRAQVSLLRHLTKHTVSLSNRLRAVLLRYYPGATVVFSSLLTQIGLQFVCAYPTPQAAQQRTWADFQAFAIEHRYTRRKQLPNCFARLQADHARALPETVAVFREEAVTLAKLLLELLQARCSYCHTPIDQRLT